MNNINEYAVYRKGGTVSERKNVKIPNISGFVEILYSNLSKDDAQELAKNKRRQLSKTDKSYYGLNYGIVPMSRIIRFS